MKTAPATSENAERLALAYAVSADGSAHYLNRDNQKVGTTSVSEAVASDRAFFVTVKVSILAIDADSQTQMPAFWKLEKGLRESGFTPVVVASGGVGRLHLFALIESGIGQWKRMARDFGLDVRSSIRPPLSPHRNGLPVRLRSPATPAEALAALTPQPNLSTGTEAMESSLRLTLRYGRPGKGRSETVQGVSTLAVRLGWTSQQVFHALMQEDNVAGAKIREIAARDSMRAVRYVEHGFTKAIRFTTANSAVSDRSSARYAIARVRDAALVAPFPGPSGATDREVLLACLSLANERASITGCSLSVRDVALKAGVHRATSARALKRLGAWIYERPDLPSSRKHARSFGFRIPSDTGETLRVTPPIDDIAVSHLCRIEPVVEAFRGFGRRGLQVWELLGTDGSTSSDVTLRAGVSVRTVQRWLHRLAAAGLAERVDDVWMRRDLDADRLSMLAAAGGTSGSASRDRERHCQEREARDSWLRHKGLE